MAFRHLWTQTVAEDRDSTPIDVEQVAQIVDQLFTTIGNLRRERDCLRSALVDAGFSLRADQIARYAQGTQSGARVIGLEPLRENCPVGR